MSNESVSSGDKGIEVSNSIMLYDDLLVKPMNVKFSFIGWALKIVKSPCNVPSR